jgi:hypothetical protein
MDMNVPLVAGPDSRFDAASRLVMPGVASLVGAVLAAIAGQALGSDLLDCWLLSTRYTARFSVSLFLLAYVAPSFALRPAGGPGSFLGRQRCALAISFAVAHTVHLGCIVVYFALRHEVPSAIAFAIGGTGYVLLYAMVVTAWSWKDTGGARWRRLHAFAPHYLWFVVLVTYISRVSERGVAWLPYLALTLAALAVRIGVGERTRKFR